jgi:ribosomal protein S18 acetylase RimI-like enzyme
LAVWLFCVAVGWLSNLLGFLDGADSDDRPATVRAARADEVEGAVRLILSPSGTPVDVQAARDFITFGRERGIDFEGWLWVAERGGKVLTAALPVISPGRTMLILYPGGLAGKAVEGAARGLLEPICAIGRARGVHLAQALIDPGDQTLARAVEDGGFSRMAELHYLQVSPRVEDRPPELPPGMEWITYTNQTHGLFARTIIESYRDSLDCPALNGLRDVEDVIAGHKASGLFDAGIWFVLREGQRALGVLLLSETLRSDAMELTYLGLVPEARGLGLGELMVRQALAVGAFRGHTRFCLAVDSRNVPALKLYYRHGMQRVGSKVAMLRDLRVQSASATMAAGEMGGISVGNEGIVR